MISQKINNFILLLTINEMLTQYFAVFILIVSSVIFATDCLQVETVSSTNDKNLYRYPVVYRRFIRRGPPIFLDDKNMEDIVEIFDTKEKPPAYGELMTDEDVDQFIFCDFNRHLDKCKQYWKSRNQKMHFLTPPTVKSFIATSSTTKGPTTISTTPSDVTTGFSKIPDLIEDEYIYSDEIQEVKNNQKETMNEDDYYDEYVP